MALQKFNNDLNIIAKLGDNPRTDDGLSTQGFKSKFDEAGLLIQSFINNLLIPQIENSVDEGSLLSQITAALNKKLNLSGGTMTGPIYMNGKKLTGLNDPTAGNEAATKRYTERYTEDFAEPKKMFFQNIAVTVASFIADATYMDYPYRAAVALEGVMGNMIPEVTFGLTDATSGIYAPIVDAYDGGVYIYAEEPPASDITIPVIVCWKGSSAE